MNITILVLALLLCVAMSAVLVRVARLPLPLTQIALGAAISLPSFGLHVDLEPELFLMIFIPPLLFADGWRMPKREFFRYRERILGLAFGLVLFTVVAVGYLLHWMIPDLPLSACFALAAVLSPTDAVSVSALAGRAGIPKQLMYVLQGEALMNDASGLTAFKFATAAAVTGAFSLSQASLAFVFVAAGGLGIGVALGWALGLFQKWLSGWTEIEAQGSIVLILLLPFAAYLMAEELGASGILAAVAAGMTLNLKSATMDPGAHARIASTHIWSMIEYVLNGVIFVLLGLQLPDIIGRALDYAWHAAGIQGTGLLLGYALATAAALIIVRLVWVWVLLHVTRFYASWRGDKTRPPPHNRLLWATAFSGVRGGITLAGVLSVPFTLDSGELFPGRNLMIFLAATVILVSLIAAAIALPLLLRGISVGEDPETEEERLARMRACEAAVAAISKHAERAAHHHKDDEDDGAGQQMSIAAGRLIDSYEVRIKGLRDEHATKESMAERTAADGDLRLVGIQAERGELMRMHARNEINETVLNSLLYEIDVRESALHLRQGKRPAGH
ncbi:Na+/H+ antiporter [Solimonas marina]|uniref:Na+/H+ antiporter n=1 Tax=Solimonas marina TaxID=2714601 RepID=A0A969W9S8_9GAMM|nr:Na+/H+ antiporter [Solimonas marina]NKF22135.1 Na+/H+ antiporter [Solimonas marina]